RQNSLLVQGAERQLAAVVEDRTDIVGLDLRQLRAALRCGLAGRPAMKLQDRSRIVRRENEELEPVFDRRQVVYRSVARFHVQAVERDRHKRNRLRIEVVGQYSEDRAARAKEIA